MAKDPGNRFSDALDIRLKNGTLTLKDSLTKVTDQLDFYRIKLAGRSNFTCLLNGLTENADLTLFDKGGREIVESEEDDEDAESIGRQLGAGTYFIRVNQIEGDTDYRIKFSINREAGDSFKQAFKIRPGKEKLKGNFTFTDEIGDDGDKFDFYQFELTDRSTCKTLLEGLKNNADIRLFNSRRKQIAFSTRGGRRSEEIDRVLDAGIYFIKIDIKTKINVTSVSTKYKLKLSFTSLTIDLGDNDIQTPRPIPPGSSTDIFDDFVGTADPEDFYRVDLTSPSNINLTLNGLSADANLELQNSSGAVIGSSTNPGTAQDLLNLNLAAGTYFVKVAPAASGTSTRYTLDFAATPLRLFGLTDTSSLAAFNPDQLTKAVSIPVAGLASGETLRGIDFRPATGTLFGLSSVSKLYTISLATGAATPVSPTPLTPALTGASVGFDFNPTVDRIRVVSDADENLRLNPDLGAIAGTDTLLAYAVGDANAAANPSIVAEAYTNNVAGATTTTLFGIDSNLDILVRQGSPGGVPASPNTGSLSTVGALKVDFGPNAGFDIFTDASLTNSAYATSGSTLYSINLTTGEATTLGTVSAGTTPVTLVGIASRT